MARSLADDFLPSFDVVMRHGVDVAAPAPVVWAALHRADFASAWYVRALLTLRGLRRPGSVRRITLDRLVANGFIPLGERAGQEVALGLVGRFWRPSGGRVRVRPEEFTGFTTPGYAKVTWTFAVEPAGPAATRVITETRVAFTDAASRHRFRLYWLGVRPFSGLIRRAMLAAVAREATRPV
ncbi:MAG TPA: hypothetical protein VGT02_19115 [Methylomirabilota bacterium]|nr:hypothetical protein [Methylomirabilota bacterium]